MHCHPPDAASPEEIAHFLEATAADLRAGAPIPAILEEIADALEQWTADFIEQNE